MISNYYHSLIILNAFRPQPTFHPKMDPKFILRVKIYRFIAVGNSQTQTRLAETAEGVGKNQTNSATNNDEVPPVMFVLFTRNYHPMMLNLNKTLKESSFDFNASTKIIIHGFLSNIRQEAFTLIRDAYLSEGNYNVIGYDWSKLCQFEYFSAMRGAKIAGKVLTQFLNYLLYNGVDYDDLHIIGHSLGAHVAGIGSDEIKGGKISRITGLDPAGPGFTEVSHDLRLDPGDAKLVDVVHTYMRVLSLAEPLGHLDFYPNGGRFQPGCPDLFDIAKIGESIACNHGRAYMYFAEAIADGMAFKSKRCGSVADAVNGRCFEDTEVYMGNVETYENGIYYVKTRATRPFSLYPEY